MLTLALIISLWEFPCHSAHILFLNFTIPYFSFNSLSSSKVPAVHTGRTHTTHTHTGLDQHIIAKLTLHAIMREHR